jgi:hypothetical protein
MVSKHFRKIYSTAKRISKKARSGISSGLRRGLSGVRKGVQRIRIKKGFKRLSSQRIPRVLKVSKEAVPQCINAGKIRKKNTKITE